MKTQCETEVVYCFLLDEKKFETSKEVVTPEIIREIAGVPENIPIVQVLRDGTQRQLQDGEEVRLEDCTKLLTLPRFIRGLGRVEAELELVRKLHPSAERTPSGVVIRDFDLPDIYRAKSTLLFVPIPPTYPHAPPDNFFVTWGLALRSGQAIGAYSGPVSIDGEQWGQFSFHAKGPWRAAANPSGGDNLLSFLLVVNARLSEGA